jgi:Tfp pilus assembly protein PilV
VYVKDCIKDDSVQQYVYTFSNKSKHSLFEFFERRLHDNTAAAAAAAVSQKNDRSVLASKSVAPHAFARSHCETSLTALALNSLAFLSTYTFLYYRYY